MTDEQGPRTPFEERVKSDFQRELRDADTREKKKSLLLRLFQAIKDAMTKGILAVDEANKPSGRDPERRVMGGIIPASAKEQKEDASTPVLKAFEAIKKSAAGDAELKEALTEALDEADLNETQRTFFTALAETNHTADTATFLVEITGKALKDKEYLRLSRQGEEPTQLEKDFVRMAGNRVAVQSFQDALMKLAEEGHLKDATGNTMTVQEVTKKFKGASPTAEADQIMESTRLQEKSRALTERIQAAMRPDKDRYAQAREDSLGAKEQIRKDSSQSQEDKKRRIDDVDARISEQTAGLIRTDSEIDAIESYLRFGEKQKPFSDEEDPEAAIRTFIKAKLGVSDEEIDVMRQDMADFSKSIDLASQEELAARMGNNMAYAELVIRMRSYTAEAIYNRVWKNGEIDEKAVIDLQDEFEDETSVLFATLYSSPKNDFNEVFSPYIEGQALKQITTSLRTRIQAVTNMIQDDMVRRGLEPSVARTRVRTISDSLLKERLVAALERKQSIEGIVHQYQQMGSQIEVEKLLEILRKFDITTLQEFYKDETTLVVSDIMPGFLQELYLQNGNKIITNLFQIVQEEQKIASGAQGQTVASRTFVVKYREEFVDYAFDIMSNLYAAKAISQKPSRERIEARFSRAFLDNFLLSLRGVKVLANATPQREGFDDIPFWHIMKGVYNPLHNWGKLGLRGRGPKGVGDAETYEVAGMRNFLYDEEGYVTNWLKSNGNIYVDYHPETEMAVAKSRILYNIAPNNKELMEDLESGRCDYFQTMLDVYKGLSFGNIIDQNGWTFKGLNENKDRLIEDVTRYFQDNEKWDELSWDDKFGLYYRTVGVVPAFWLTGDRAGSEVGAKFEEYLAGVDGGEMTEEEKSAAIAEFKNKQGSEGMRKLLEKYTDGENRFKKIINVTVGGKEKKVTHRDYFNKRLQSLRGEVFHQLLLKDPQHWLGEMVQKFPELVDGYVDYTTADGHSIKGVKGSEFYFNLTAFPDSEISAADREKRDRFRFNILTQFRGKEGDRLSNVPHIQKIMDFYAQLEDEYTGEVVKGHEQPLEGDAAKKYGMSQLAKQLAFARRLAVANKEPEINPQDVLVRDESGNVIDDRLFHAMYGAEGLVTYFEEMVGDKQEYFGDGNTNLGADNGFYQRWGRWEMTNRRILPEGDTNMDLLTQKIENKQALERRLNTDKCLVDAQAVMDEIPSVLDKAGNAQNFKEWYGIIEEGIHGKLKGIAGEDQMLEQQYQMDAFIAVCNYYMKDSDANTMLVGALNAMKLGANLSISSIKADATGKFVLTADRVYDYIGLLREKRYLKAGFNTLGGWGLDTAKFLSGADFTSIVMGQLGYLMMALPLLLLAASAKEAYDQEVEKS